MGFTVFIPTDYDRGSVQTVANGIREVLGGFGPCQMTIVSGMSQLAIDFSLRLSEELDDATVDRLVAHPSYDLPECSQKVPTSFPDAIIVSDRVLDRAVGQIAALKEELDQHKIAVFLLIPPLARRVMRKLDALHGSTALPATNGVLLVPH